MAYAVKNFKTKKAFKEAVKVGPVPAFQPGGMFPLKEGRNTIEGPHAPQPHKWYASVLIENGNVIKVLS